MFTFYIGNHEPLGSLTKELPIAGKGYSNDFDFFRKLNAKVSRNNCAK